MMPLDVVMSIRNRENNMNSTEQVINYYIDKLKNENITNQERERIENILDQYMNKIIDIKNDKIKKSLIELSKLFKKK